MNYTLVDYEKAKADLAGHDARWDSYLGNNPEKGRSARNACLTRMQVIEANLKAAGVLPQSDQEKLEQALDRAFPNAKNNQVIEFADKKYQRTFTPTARSNSGKSVTQWTSSWRTILGIIVAICLISMPNSVYAVTVVGSDLMCWSWGEVRRAPLSQQPMSTMELESSILAESWALGFLSGLAVNSGEDILKNVDPNSIWPWIDIACRTEPTATVGDVLLKWKNTRRH